MLSYTSCTSRLHRAKRTLIHAMRDGLVGRGRGVGPEEIGKVSDRVVECKREFQYLSPAHKPGVSKNAEVNSFKLNVL